MFHIALTYCIQATRNPNLVQILLTEAKRYFEQSQQIFQQAGRPDLVAGVISPLGEVLQRLQLWEMLQELALGGVKMHLVYGTSSQLAQDYVFMAEVALKRSEWRRALMLAKLALTILPESKPTVSQAQCLLLLARCYQYQGEWQQAKQKLELALTQIQPQYNPQLYLDILEELRDIDYQQGQYRQAFRIKKKQREIEHQYGLRAFIGAAQLQPPKQAINPSSNQGENMVTIAEEMMASCRQHDIQNLLHRLSRDDHKLIIIHGRSGVGKSSLVNAGLVPALKNTAISARDCLPVVIQSYMDWTRELEQSLASALLNCASFKYPDESIKKLWYKVIAQSSIQDWNNRNPNQSYEEIPVDCILNSSSFVLKQLTQNAEQNLLTVLIFDQFEEFFFISHCHQEKRKVFYDFLKICLDLPFVKIVLSLREDYLHHLLEWDHLLNLDAINNNILDKKIRYHLRDFTLAEAKTVIERLTQRSKLQLEPGLIDALVTDLADERQEVRPIELQVVGAQLQEEGEHGITTLTAYKQLGINPKTELIKHSIEQAVAPLTWVAFSPDGQVLAIAVADGTVKLLKLDGTILHTLDHTANPNKTVYKVSFSPNGQLIATVGQDQTVKLWTPQGQLLKTLKADRSNIYGVNFSPDSKLLATSTDNKNIYLWTVDGTLLKQWQGHGDKVTNIQFSPDGKTLVSSSYDKTVKLWSSDLIPLKTLTGHQHRVLGVNFSPNGEMFASASQDKTVKLWSRTGALLTTLAGYKDRVTTVSFSPDGELLATAGYDRTVKLWKLSPDLESSEKSQGSLFKLPDNFSLWGVAKLKSALPLTKNRVSVESIQLLQSWIGHDDSILNITFSPNAEQIATASKDKTVKLWSRQGQLLHTLIGHDSWVNSVTFSPGGEMIVTSSDDGTIKLWDDQGKLLKTIMADQGYVLGISFSPDGKFIASAGYDNTVKLWDSRGNYLKTLLKGSSDSVTSVVFSPDSQLIASASYDGTVKLWSRDDGTLLKTLVGHRDSVMGISFSPDGRVLVSASRDHTLIMWNLDLDNLIDRACDWVYDYLRTNPKVQTSDRDLCNQ